MSKIKNMIVILIVGLVSQIYYRYYHINMTQFNVFLNSSVQFETQLKYIFLLCTKTRCRKATIAATSTLAKKVDSAILESDVDELDTVKLNVNVDKLNITKFTISVDLKKLKDVVKMGLLKKRCISNYLKKLMIMKIRFLAEIDLVRYKSQQDTDKQNLIKILMLTEKQQMF